MKPRMRTSRKLRNQKDIVDRISFSLSSACHAAGVRAFDRGDRRIGIRDYRMGYIDAMDEYIRAYFREAGMEISDAEISPIIEWFLGFPEDSDEAQNQMAAHIKMPSRTVVIDAYITGVPEHDWTPPDLRIK